MGISLRSSTLALLAVAAALGACQGGETGSGSDQAGDPSVPVSAAGAPPPGRYFPDGPWYLDVSEAAVDAESQMVVGWLDSQGWGTGAMRIDFSLEVLEGTEDSPARAFNPTQDFFEPDCDRAEVPVPPGGALEGETGYACDGDGDCHLIVVHRPTLRLFEMWRADIRGDVFDGGCLAVWDMTRTYGPRGRGEQCTSADAAGYPIAPLLFSADEVAAGTIGHAIRFVLPNSRIRSGQYVHPATHGTPATSGPPQAPPYGTRLRLRPGFAVDSLPSPGARVVARALQSHGMFLADGGQITLTAQSDRFTSAKWEGLLESRDLESIRPRDFEMIEAGPRILLTLDCVREP